MEHQLNQRSRGGLNTLSFNHTFNAHNHADEAYFDEKFVEVCFDTAQTDSRNTGTSTARSQLSTYFRAFQIDAPGQAFLRRGIKLLLLELWRSETILLPTTFAPGPSFPLELFDNQLLQWLHGIDPNYRGQTGSPADLRRLRYYGPRLLFTTNWMRPCDISLVELASLHRASRLYLTQASATVIAGGAQLPFTFFAASALRQFPDEVQFNTQELARYSRWAHSMASRASFEEFIEPSPPVRQTCTAGVQTSERAEQGPALAKEELVLEGHDALRNAFVNYRRQDLSPFNWGQMNTLSYKGREHIDLSDLTPKWIEAMRAFLHHRAAIKGYRSDTGTKTALTALADYLFLYLPWWLELAKNPKVSPPKCPKTLSRFGFITRHTNESLDEFPETLMTVLAWRGRSKDSIGIIVRQLSLFFAFIEVHFSEDESIAGRDFRNPIDKNFDVPRSKKRHKTNKHIIPKNVYGHLVFYCYALEEAGMKLMQMAIAGELNTHPRARLTAPTLNLSQLGLEGIGVKHRSKLLPLKEIPNVFEWHTRHLKNPASSGSASAFLPSCSVLRLLTTSVETGLRAQSVQWLDKRTWRKLASATTSDCYTFRLFVNTDKTKDTAWDTPVVYRVRDMLHRQEQFQDLFVDADAYQPVLYEGVDSPFAPIEPLFRAARGPNPVSDSLYFEKWQRLMVGFEEYFRTATGEQHAEFFTLKPTCTRDGQTKIREKSRAPYASGKLYCPLSLLAVHTPHSCRATFATNRRGILSLPEAAELLGHQDLITTAHYDKPSIEDLQERLKESDLSINQDFIQFEQESVVHVRADKTESTLVQSFKADRTETIKHFGFIPGIRLWSTEESLGPDQGIRLLREGPMSRIKFRETHVCPVGEECPADIIELIGAPRRCGCCPLSLKCVDHGPAIAAKQNLLLERIRFQHGLYRRLEANGEPVAVLDEIWEELELDANEYLGWQMSSELLADLPPTTSNATGPVLLVKQPDIVRRHLIRVTRSTDVASFILQRIADSNAYPSMTSPQVQIAASQIKRRLLASTRDYSPDFEDDMHSAVSDAAAMLAVMMKATGLSREQVSRSLGESKPRPGSLLPKVS